MLQTQTTPAATLELLTKLQSKNYLSGFKLVGGTALAFYWGHRKSIDLDLFSNESFEAGSLIEQLQQDFQVQVLFTAKNTVKGSINGVNVDFIAHRYPYLHPPVKTSGITLLSEEDILAMKLNAISTSGQRSKDFIDVYFGLKKHSLPEMLGFYRDKYSQNQTGHVLKSLIYFDDVDQSDWPVMLKETGLTWEKVMQDLESAVLSINT